jgi:ankyrin repeat protein
VSLVLERLRQFWWCEVDEEGLDIPLTDVNQLNIFGESPIHLAASKGQPEDIVWLVENGADVNRPGDFGMTPLHYAYMSEKQNNILTLLHCGADPNLPCEAGLLPHEGRDASLRPKRESNS